MQQALLISYFIALGCSAIVCYWFRQRHQPPLTWLWVYLVITLATDAFAEYLHVTGWPFQPVFILYGPVEYAFIATLYRQVIDNRLVKKIILLAIPGYALVCFVYYFQLKYLTHYYIFNLRGCLIISVVLYYFQELYNRNQIVDLKNEPMFFVSIGNLLFWSGTFFIMGLVNPLNKLNPVAGKLLFAINPILNIFLYFTYARAIVCKRKVNPSS